MPKVILTFANIYNIYKPTTRLFWVVLLSLFISASLAGLFVSSAHAETVDYNVNVEPALNVTIPTDTISLLLDPTNKTFSSQELNISVGTNNPYGYRLTMSSTGTSLVHTEDSNYTIPTLPSLAGGYTDESFIADKWGYKQDSSAWNSYTSGVTLLESNAPVNNDNTNLSFGAKIDYAQAPGNYTLVLNFNAVAKVATNDLVITFAGEGVSSVKVCTVAGDCTGDNLLGTVTSSGGSVPGLEDGSTYYLYPTFTSGHEFVSWAKTSTAGTISATDTLNPTFTMTDEPASVTITGKSSLPTITFVTNDASSINFNGIDYPNNQTVNIAPGTYQIYGNYGTRSAFKTWAKSGSGSFGNSAYQLTTFTVSGNATITLTGQSVTTAMQDLSATSCTDTPKPVYDTRDNEVYWIQKLADDNCWMLDNLRLGGTSTINLTTSNTHSNGSYTLPASGTTCFTSDANCDSSNNDAHTGYTVAAINTASKNIVNTDTTENWGYGSGKYGVYYNYCAASVGTYCMASSSSGQNASYDVCPKGWKMPTGGSTGQYQSLCDKIKGESCGSPWADNGVFHTALSTPLSGLFRDGSAYGQASSGYFWSSTRSSATNMYFLRVTSSSVNPQYSSSRYLGRSVRCILGS